MEAIAAEEEARSILGVGGGEEFNVSNSVGCVRSEVSRQIRNGENGEALGVGIVSESDVGLFGVAGGDGSFVGIREIEAPFFGAADIGKSPPCRPVQFPDNSIRLHRFLLSTFRPTVSMKDLSCQTPMLTSA